MAIPFRPLILAFFLFATAASAQTPNTQLDSDFIYDPTEAGMFIFDFQEYGLNTVHALSDGKIMLVGSFREVSNAFAGIKRLNSDGSIDMSFSAWGTDKNVQFRGRSFLELPNGKYLVGGIINSGQFGSFVSRLKCLNADGSLDTDFGSGLSYPGVEGIALQPDGKILIGGAWASAEWGANVARLNPDGSKDNSFSVQPLVVRDVRGLTLLPDGRILVAGNFTDWPVADAAPHITVGLALLNADGSLDTSFSHNSGTTVSLDLTSYPRVAVQPDGKIVVAQRSGSASNTVQVLRYNADLSIDTDFYVANNPAVGGAAFHGVTVLNDGKILLAGSVIDYDGNTDISGVFRLNPDGTVDESFNTNRGFGNSAPVLACDVQSDGKILLFQIGNTYQDIDINANETYPVRQLVVRLNGDGVGPPTFVQEAPVPFDFKVYPNPATEYLVVDDLPIGCQVIVTNLSGQTIFTSVINDKRFLLNTSDFANGVYLIHVNSTQGVADRRFIVR